MSFQPPRRMVELAECVAIMFIVTALVIVAFK